MAVCVSLSVISRAVWPSHAQDIYIARAEGELALEEELYWALINIYRVPSVLFDLTKKTG